MMSDAVGDLADRIAALVLATPGVVGLHSGMFGEVGTYLAGRRVPGVRVTDGAVDVHLIVDTSAPLRSTAAAVRAAVAAVAPDSAVTVTVEDVGVQPNVQPDVREDEPDAGGQ